MTGTPPSHAVDHVFLANMYEVLERTQSITPKPDRAELIKVLRPLRDQLVHLTGSPEELKVASAQMRRHLEQFAATSLGSPEAQQIMQLTDPNAVANILAGSRRETGRSRRSTSCWNFRRGVACEPERSLTGSVRVCVPHAA